MLKHASMVLMVLMVLIIIENPSLQAAEPASYPVKPIEVVTFQAAGSGFDIVTRLISDTLSKYLGQPIIVVNKPGGAGSISAADVINSRPDGYKLYVQGTNYFGITVKTQKLSFDPTLLVPIANFVEWVNLVYVKSDSPWNSINDLIKYGKENPGKLRWAHPGRGLAPVHLSTYLLFRRAGVEAVDLPFKGSAEMLAACLGGHVDAVSGPYTAVKENMRAKQIRVLLTWADQRHKDPSDVPCQVELGFPKEWTLPSSASLFVHKNTPENIKKILLDASKKVLEDKEFEKRVEHIGAEPKFGGPELVNERIRNAEEVGTPILKELGLYVAR